MKGTLPNLLSATICHFTDGEWHTESCHRGAGELEDTATWTWEAETERLRFNKIHRQQHVCAQSALPPPSQLHCQPEERWERDFIRICCFFSPNSSSVALSLFSSCKDITGLKGWAGEDTGKGEERKEEINLGYHSTSENLALKKRTHASTYDKESCMRACQ